MGRNPRLLRRRRDLRSNPELRPRLHRDHDIVINLDGDDRALVKPWARLEASAQAPIH